jgi:hypothetical protein
LAWGKSFVFLLTGKFPRDQAMYNEKSKKINRRKYAKGVSDELANIIEKAREHDKKKDTIIPRRYWTTSVD